MNFQDNLTEAAFFLLAQHVFALETGGVEDEDIGDPTETVDDPKAELERVMGICEIKVKATLSHLPDEDRNEYFKDQSEAAAKWAMEHGDVLPGDITRRLVVWYTKNRNKIY